MTFREYLKNNKGNFHSMQEAAEQYRSINNSVQIMTKKCHKIGKVYNQTSGKCKNMEPRTNLLKNLSYVEFKQRINNKYVYISQFPTTAVKMVTNPKYLPKNGSRVFSTKITKNNLLELLVAMVEYNIGIVDNILWMVDKKYHPKTINLIDLQKMMNDLTFKVTENLDVSIVYNNDSEIKVYVKEKSLPQEASDTVVILSDKNKNYVVFSEKGGDGNVTVNVKNGDSLNLICKPPVGTVIPGEHIEPNELNQIKKDYVDMKASGVDYLKLVRESFAVDKDGKPIIKNNALRTIYEEVGFTAEDFMANTLFSIYFLGVDKKAGRDSRYWVFGDDNQYGYRRKSMSYMFCVKWDREVPTNMPKPVDVHEINKAFTVPLNQAKRQFSENGKFPPAFPAHQRMFRHIVNVMTKNNLL